MPISPSDRAFLKQLYANLADEALKPESAILRAGLPEAWVGRPRAADFYIDRI